MSKSAKTYALDGGQASRTKRSMRNVVVGLGGRFASLIVTFLAKTIFIDLLGAEYNGVNGLFTNVLNVLNITELGFASSVAFALYKPLKENDRETVAALMNFFARIYRVVALIVAVAGACCIPFLQYIIAEDISELPFTLDQLRGYFAMFLVSTVLSYLLAYKRTLISADQSNYITSLVDNICSVGLNIAQIVLLLIYKNYYVYLGLMIAKTVLNNAILQIIANKKYPYLKAYKRAKISKQERNDIFRNVQALFLQRIGSVAASGTISIVISAFVSLIDAGKYSNYIMITSNVNITINIIFSAVTASIGNLCASENEDAQIQVFKRIRYLSSFFTVFTFACYVGLFDPFIEIWIGADMLMPFSVMVAIALSASVKNLAVAVETFKDAKGMFKNDWYRPIIEAVVGIGSAIGLSYVWGTFGVILGYALANLLITVPIENIVLFRQGFHRPAAGQFINQIGALILAFGCAAVTYSVNGLMPSGVGWFIVKAMFSIVFTILTFVAVTCRTEEFEYYKGLCVDVAKNIMKKIKRKGNA